MLCYAALNNLNCTEAVSALSVWSQGSVGACRWCILSDVWLKSFCWWRQVLGALLQPQCNIWWKYFKILSVFWLSVFFSVFPLNQKGLFSWELVQFKFTDLPLAQAPWSCQSLLVRRSLPSRNPHTPFIRAKVLCCFMPLPVLWGLQQCSQGVETGYRN